MRGAAATRRSNCAEGYGIREVVRSVESAVVDGLIAVKDDGYTRVVDGRVSVQPVASDTEEITKGAQS